LKEIATMTIRLLLGLAAALALAAPAASAASKHHRNSRLPHVHTIAGKVPGSGSSFEPARIIEARPGVFISSYGCITDEGYGRWTYCGQGRGGGD
jgi:hypothetical protein